MDTAVNTVSDKGLTKSSESGGGAIRGGRPAAHTGKGQAIAAIVFLALMFGYGVWEIYKAIGGGWAVVVGWLVAYPFALLFKRYVLGERHMFTWWRKSSAQQEEATSTKPTSTAVSEHPSLRPAGASTEPKEALGLAEDRDS
jgi:hypothetical protein